MIEETLLKSLEHAPSLVAMLVLVMMFLRFLKALLDAHAKRTDEFVRTVRELNEEREEARAHSITVIERNTIEMTRMTEANNRAAEATREMTEALRKFVLENVRKEKAKTK